MVTIIIIPCIFVGLILWDIYWFKKLVDIPPDIPYPITMSAIPDFN